MIQNLQGGRDRRRREPIIEHEYEIEEDDEDEEDIVSEVGRGGMGRPRGGRRGRGPREYPKDRDGANLGSIKMKIQSF